MCGRRTYLLLLLFLVSSSEGRQNQGKSQVSDYEYDDDNYDLYDSDVPQPKIFFGLPWAQKLALKFSTTTPPTTMPTVAPPVPNNQNNQGNQGAQGGNGGGGNGGGGNGAGGNGGGGAGNGGGGGGNGAGGGGNAGGGGGNAGGGGVNGGGGAIQDQVFLGFLPNFAPEGIDSDAPFRRRRPQISQYQPIVIFRQNPNSFGFPYPFFG